MVCRLSTTISSGERRPLASPTWPPGRRLHLSTPGFLRTQHTTTRYKRLTPAETSRPCRLRRRSLRRTKTKRESWPNLRSRRWRTTPLGASTPEIPPKGRIAAASGSSRQEVYRHRISLSATGRQTTSRLRSGCVFSLVHGHLQRSAPAVRDGG